MESILDERKRCRSLDMSKIKRRKTGTISLEESLKDVFPIEWTDDVLNGKRKIIISKQK